MGSRKGYDFSGFTGAGRQVTQAITRTKRALKSRPAGVVVATAVDVLALSNPALGALVSTYKLSKTVYQVTNAAAKSYGKTGDISVAVAVAARETLKASISEATSQTIRTTVETSWSVLKKTADISTSELQDRILTSAVTNTIEEVFQPEKGKR